jgi:hypothetical protein
MLYRGMNRTQLDTAYNNTAAVPERDAIVAGWAARSARVRRERPGHLDLAYGKSPSWLSRRQPIGQCLRLITTRLPVLREAEIRKGTGNRKGQPTHPERNA